MSNAAYSDITGKMDCTVKKTNFIKIDKDFHQIGKYFGHKALMTNEKFEIFYSVNTKKISIELANIYSRYKGLDHLFFYKRNPFYFSINDPKIFLKNGLGKFEGEINEKHEMGYYLESKYKYEPHTFIVSRNRFLASQYNKFGDDTTYTKFQLKKYNKNNWMGFIYLDGSHVDSYNLKTILYTITFDCFSNKDLSEVSSFIQNNFKWE